MNLQLCTETEKNRPFLGSAALKSQMEPVLMHLEAEREERCAAGHPPAQASRPTSAKTSTSQVCSAHAQFIAALAGSPPRTIPLDADAIDLEDRAAHVGSLFGALSVYLAVILDDTAQNVPGRLDLPDVEAHLADLAAGIIERAAENMRGWIA